MERNIFHSCSKKFYSHKFSYFDFVHFSLNEVSRHFYEFRDSKTRSILDGWIFNAVTNLIMIF